MSLEVLDDKRLLELIDLNTQQPADKDTIIIDIRSSAEYAQEHIAGSRNLPLDSLESADLSEFADKKLLFHCRSGNRTQQASKKLAMIPSKQQWFISGGLSQWKAAGLPTVSATNAPLDIMRQVQIVVGLMILVGFALAYLISSAFLILPIIAGIGMLNAGLTGSCGMAKMLMLLPYNRPKS